jgi:glycosyltransferase involved in cell wall biosynthesis
MESNPLVSVTIPTYNSDKTLTKCLESIRNQTYKNVEVIVVDNYSKDKTVEIAKKYSAKIIEKKCNKPEARNIGILSSKGDYILLLDSDMMLEKEVVEKGVAKFYNEGCDALFIDEEYLDDGFLKKCRNLEKIAYRGNPIIEAPRFYKKILLLKLSSMKETRDPMNMIFISL